MKTEQVIFRLPAELLTKMDNIAKKANISRSAAFRDAAEHWVETRSKQSAYEKSAHLCGRVQGLPADASTSDDYLKQYEQR